MKYSRLLRSFFSLSAKLLVIAALFFAGTYVFELINAIHMSRAHVAVNVNADGPINVWWPTDGSHVSDTQAFKAMVQDHNVDDYDMFWSVDGGQQNQMGNSQTDYPHKEAMVDLKAWTWHGAGPYKVTFSAVDHSGNSLGQTSVNIYTPEPQQGPTTVQSANVVSALTGVSMASADTNSSSSSGNSSSNTNGQSSSSNSANSNSVTITPAATLAPVPVVSPAAQPQNTSTFTPTPSPSPSPAPIQPANPTVNAWWPTNNANVSGTFPFKAVVDGMQLSNYTMYWQVDGGQLNGMVDINDHKEASVDVSNWNWRGNGPYNITFVAKNLAGNEIARTDVTIHVGGNDQPSQQQTQNSSSNQNSSQTQNSNQAQASSSPQPQNNQPVNSQPANPVVITPVQPVLNAISPSGDPFSGENFYLDPNNDAKKYADSIRSSNSTDATQMDKIGNTPTAIWLGGWNSDVGSFVRQQLSTASSQGAMQTFVVYNIPFRDCGQYSAGGVNTPDEYRSWIQAIADATGNSKAMFVLEPDAVALTTCLSQSQLSDRNNMLQTAVSILKSHSNTHVYIDAGHPNWISADDMASRLNQAGISGADGFALNTSNFFTTADNITYGTAVSAKVGGKHFIIDTGRNGSGPTPDNQWCNPSGRTLGSKPTANTGNSLVDAFFWLKGPGGSDGNCSGGPNAGVFWPEYALDMARRSN